MNVQVGSPAPDFNLPDQLGNNHKLSDLRGSWILLYFYPKDDTPGCTVEACSFRDNLPKFDSLKAHVLGISVDTVESHKKFSEKHKLPFIILADTDKKVVNQYGVWQKKKFLGREFMGIVRTSFLIDPEGKVTKIYERVNPANHVAEVVSDLDRLTV